MDSVAVIWKLPSSPRPVIPYDCLENCNQVYAISDCWLLPIKVQPETGQPLNMLVTNVLWGKVIGFYLLGFYFLEGTSLFKEELPICRIPK